MGDTKCVLWPLRGTADTSRPLPAFGEDLAERCRAIPGCAPHQRIMDIDACSCAGGGCRSHLKTGRTRAGRGQEESRRKAGGKLKTRPIGRHRYTRGEQCFMRCMAPRSPMEGAAFSNDAPLICHKGPNSIWVPTPLRHGHPDAQDLRVCPCPAREGPASPRPSALQEHLCLARQGITAGVVGQ